MILICGPCVIENFDKLERDAAAIKSIVDKYPDVDFYFKSSCIKENRTNLKNYRGLGFNIGLAFLRQLRDKYGIKITTDFHTSKQIEKYAHIVDLIQIPAFLAMQTGLVNTAAKIGKPIHIKKPQWLPPYDISKPVSKVFDQTDVKVFVTDRGTTFGYGDVIFDPRHIKKMKRSGADKILVDITHLQNHSKIYSRTYAEPVGMAAIAAGADGLYMESTINPDEAQCDSDCMIPMKFLDEYIDKFVKLHRFINA